MDEITTGLDASNAAVIVQCFRHLAHLQQATVLMALLQPSPEIFNLFDDVLLLAEGGRSADQLSQEHAESIHSHGCKSVADPTSPLQLASCLCPGLFKTRAILPACMRRWAGSAGRLVYSGPREELVPFFSWVGLCCPERKNVADFVQEICSEKDQEVQRSSRWHRVTL